MKRAMIQQLPDPKGSDYNGEFPAYRLAGMWPLKNKI